MARPGPGLAGTAGPGVTGVPVGSGPAGIPVGSGPAGIPVGVVPAVPAGEPGSGRPVPATLEAMLALPGRLLPPGRLSETARTGPRELQVRLYRDRGHGPGMIRLSLSGRSGPGPRTGISAVAALSVAEARAVAADPRWGVRMDPALVRAGAREYPDVATFG